MGKKEKKPIYKKWWFWTLAVLIIGAIAVGTGTGEDNTAASQTTPGTTPGIPLTPTATPIPDPTPKPTSAPAPEPVTYGDGQYKVGEDLAAGEYTLVSDTTAYFEIAKDSTGSLDSILANDNFSNRSIVTVDDGQYLKINGCIMYAFADAPAISMEDGSLPEGMYKVGFDLNPGEYKVIPKESGYVELSKDSLHTLDSILLNDILTGEQYITVENGQYIKLSGASLKMK